MLRFCGDTQTFRLTLNKIRKGSAWLRTNIGYGRIGRQEIIREIDSGETPLGRDWFDIPMVRTDDFNFEVTLPLCEVGHFEAKCFFAEEGRMQPLWPAGGNVVINIEPADACCANIIYNAFIRQFGPNKKGAFQSAMPSENINALDSAGYTVIPPSGTFRDLIRELDFIIGELGCRIIQLLPIHPTPTTYGRMGRFGSPYAALSFTAVDPALAEFDSSATPLEQFVELVDAVHARNARLIIDIAINHTGWAAGLHESHSRWLLRNSRGEIEVPGAWGVRWEDLTRLDYTQLDLWQYMADVFLTWCRRGVDGFRCDAGYMIPIRAWTYIIAKVREQFPDTIFHLEGLGGKISVMRQLLNRANFNWAYSELFQNYDRRQIQAYFEGIREISKGEGVLVHFAETHDNPRLAAHSHIYARMRTTLCALFSEFGAFGFANGVEWFATDKINVHESPSLNWGAEPNQVDAIRRLGKLLRVHPAFGPQCRNTLIQAGEGNFLVMLREHLPSGARLLITVNLDDQQSTTAVWSADAAGMAGSSFLDILSEKAIEADRSEGLLSIELAPGQVYCLTGKASDLETIRDTPSLLQQPPDKVLWQCLRAKAIEIYRFFHGNGDIGNFDPDQAAGKLRDDPVEYCRRINPHNRQSRVVFWRWPRDIHREVMIPPEHFLLVTAEDKFHARIIDIEKTLGREESLPDSEGTHFALFAPFEIPESHRSLQLELAQFAEHRCQHETGHLLLLTKAENIVIRRRFNRLECKDPSLLFLGTNRRGAMLRAAVSWGKLNSRYDGLLAPNNNPDYPEDRLMVLARCRAWLVYQGYSQKIGDDCLSGFCYGMNSSARWDFNVPSGLGESVALTVRVSMVRDCNTVQLAFIRPPSDGTRGGLADHKPIQLILRPDIEYRNFHHTTKAYQGLENRWPDAVTVKKSGFIFSPEASCSLSLSVTVGEFVAEPEWHYMVHRPMEADRGLDPDSDLFSPGYFSLFLEGGRQATLFAETNGERPSTAVSEADHTADTEAPEQALRKALDHYVVRRQPLKSVIAGYPWFLDWGRDALIFTRGLIACRRLDEAGDIIEQFGRFEKEGTIPNMIQGKDATNRDTSDAPLWFIVACRDMVDTGQRPQFLERSRQQRSLRHILLSIGHGLTAGTLNGIRMDPESALLYSPAHFSWMDTDHPAGTPREGYPVEIQALWYAALRFLGQIDTAGEGDYWQRLADRVRSSIMNLYFLKSEGYFSDCLHAGSGIPAVKAEPDDALRPNQLLALTLEAVTDRTVTAAVLSACEELLVPGAIRSLADRPVKRPLEIIHRGRRLNDPYYPYFGHYSGDEDTLRKPAYHNGTAWTWLFPSYCEALAMVYGENGRAAARDLLGSGMRHLESECLGHVPEILDGNYPHTPRGCDAQAWGVSELLRVWLKLKPTVKSKYL